MQPPFEKKNDEGGGGISLSLLADMMRDTLDVVRDMKRAITDIRRDLSDLKQVNGLNGFNAVAASQIHASSSVSESDDDADADGGFDPASGLISANAS